MATKIVDEQPAAPVRADAPRIDEVMVCRLLAQMSKMWPEEAAVARPKLTLIHGGKERAA